jgi:alpha-glucosidase
MMGAAFAVAVGYVAACYLWGLLQRSSTTGVVVEAVATFLRFASKRFSTMRKRTGSVFASFVALLIVLNACSSSAATAITISEGTNKVRVVLLADDVIRLRVGPGGLFPNDANPEYVVIKPDSEWPGASNQSSDPNTIDTGKLRLVFTHNPLKLTISDHGGRKLVRNYRIDFARPKAAWDLYSDEHVYGFGDKKNDIDKRGTRMEIWNVDTDYQDQSTGLMGYKSIPMYWSSRGYGVYLHNWWRSRFDVGQFNSGRVEISADGGEMDFYIFYGPSLKQIVNRYTELTGRPALLPKWALGYHQGGASNDRTREWASNIASNMRKNHLPIDVVYYDDVDPATFTKAFVQNMWNEHHVKITAGYGMPWAYEGSSQWNNLNNLAPKGVIVDEEGRSLLHQGNGMDKAFSEIDFFNPAASDATFDAIWAGPLRNGVWNGMLDFGELDYVPDAANAFFPYFAKPKRSVEEMHNIYAIAYFTQMMTRAADYVAGVKTKSRMIGYCRPGTAGSQRYGWTSTGDSQPTFSGLQTHTKGVLNLVMSGYSAVGYDIGGWAGVPADDVYARWFEAGMFNPFAWAHGEGDHTCYIRPREIIGICRAALERRYQLLPYLYSINFESSQNGTPMMRTLPFETNGEAGTENINDEWFLGPSILVAPVLDAQSSRNVFLPSGQWFDYGDGKTVYEGGKRIIYEAELGKIPVFIKAGAIIPTGPVMQYSSEKPLDPLILDVYPAKQNSSFVLFEDDGEYGYEQGRYSTTRYDCVEQDGKVIVAIGARNARGGYLPKKRKYVVKVHGRSAAKYSVTLNHALLAQGWDYAPQEQALTVTINDDGRENMLSIEPATK